LTLYGLVDLLKTETIYILWAKVWNQISFLPPLRVNVQLGGITHYLLVCDVADLHIWPPITYVLESWLRALHVCLLNTVEEELVQWQQIVKAPIGVLLGIKGFIKCRKD